MSQLYICPQCNNICSKSCEKCGWLTREWLEKEKQKRAETDKDKR